MQVIKLSELRKILKIEREYWAGDNSLIAKGARHSLNQIEYHAKKLAMEASCN